MFFEVWRQSMSTRIMARAHLDSLAVDLVRPSTVIPEGGGALSHVKSLSSAERLSVVEGLDGREDVSVSLDQFGDLDKDLSSLESGSVQSPSSVESLAGGFDGDFDVGLDTLGNGGEDFAGGGVDDTGVSATSASPGARRVHPETKRVGTAWLHSDPSNSLDGLGVLVHRLGPLAINVQPSRDLDLALVAGVVKLVSEGGSHFVKQ